MTDTATIDIDATTEQLRRHLDRGGQYRFIQSFGADGHGKSIWHEVAKPFKLPMTLDGSRDVYWGVNPTNCIVAADDRKKDWTQGKTDKEIAPYIASKNDTVAAVNALYAEFDGKDFTDPSQAEIDAQYAIIKAAAGDIDDKALLLQAKSQAKSVKFSTAMQHYKALALKHIRGLRLQPSALVDSGGGYQGYWLFAETFIIDAPEKRNYIKWLQSAWVEHVGGDMGAKDLRRILRVPGLRNLKKAYAPNYPTVSYVDVNLDLTYSIAELEALVPPRPAPEQRTAQRGGTFNAQRNGNGYQGESVTDAFNTAYKIADTLLDCGYTWRGDRMVKPGGKNPTVVIDEDENKSFHHGGEDPLHTGYWVKPFGVFLHYKHGGNMKQAVKAAAELLDMGKDRDDFYKANGNPLGLISDVPQTSEELLASLQEVTASKRIDPDTGEILSDDAPAANGTPGSASTGQQRKTRVSAKIDKATQIYQLALQHCQIFTGDDGAVYATVEMGGHFENMNVRSMRFRQWLGKLYYDEVGAVAGKSSCDEAVEVLSFQTGTAVKTFLRVGGTDTSVYLDLGNSQWEAVEIDANGWRILDNAPVRFRRTAKMQPLPTPVKTNVEAALVELFSLINIAAEDRMLVIAWLLAAMRHKGPYPVLTLIAEPGSAKTTTAKALKRLISPYVAETRSRPKTVEDVYVASNNDWILVYDNLSSIPLDISDAFCRMATGGGFATRELYENLEEVVIDQQQPLIINGVADIVRKGDLASRIVTVTLPTITTDNRIDESEWEKRFTDAHPRILGALLDLLSYVTAELPKVKCPLPRMADFAKLGVALDTVTGTTGKTQSFAERYAESNRQGTMTVIENSPTYRPLWRFMVKAGSWDGTAASLLEELRKVSTFTEKLDLPKAGNALVKELNGIAPNLRTAQIIDIRCGRTKKGSHISLAKLPDFDRGELDNAYSDTEPESTPGF